MKEKAVFISVLFLLNLISCFAWGNIGHHIICSLAQSQFSEKTKEAVSELLPDAYRNNFTSSCTWADLIKWKAGWHWTSPMHFINTADFSCRFNYSQDCHYFKKQNLCLAGGINNYTNQLVNFAMNSTMIPTCKSRSLLQFPFIRRKVLINFRKSSGIECLGYNVSEALMFLSHFIGDIHQPLHVGFKGDEGGNAIKILWYGHKRNLHHLWDEDMIDRAIKVIYFNSLSVMISSIRGRMNQMWLNQTKNCPGDSFSCPNCYATESAKVACKWAYRNATPGSNLTDEYFNSRLSVMEIQLAKGGLRLANILNQIFEMKM